MPLDVLTLGEPLMELSEVDGRYLPGYGGDVSNVAVAVARQGARAGIVTRLGTDIFGDRFLALWRAEGIDARAVARDPDRPTGAYLISYGPDGHQFSYYRKGSAASALTPADVGPEVVADARVLHLSGITQAISNGACDATFAALDHARAAGVTVAFDPNLRLRLWPEARARAVLLATAAASDLCLPSLEEGRLLTRRHDPDAVVDALLAAGAGAVALKLGAEGVLVADAHGRARLPPHPVTTVDATGAGDTFDGAFLSAWLRTGELVAAARYANVAAALSTRGHGAVTPIPTRAEVEAALGT